MRARSLSWTALLVALSVVALSGAARADPVALLLSSSDAPVTPSVELLEDPSHSLTIHDVVAGPASARFARVTRVDLGYRRAAFWVRFSVLREAGAPPMWVVRLAMTPSRAELYTPQQGGGFAVKVSGTALPFGVRELSDTHIAFSIEPPPSRTTTYYVRLEFENTARVALELYPEAAYRARLEAERLTRGMYYGAILALVAYNALLFLVTRDRASLMYIVFELTFVLHQSSLDKLSFQYLWPGSPLWARTADVVFACATIFGGLGFVRSFLSLPETAPRLARACAWLMVGTLVCGAVGAATMLPALRASAGRLAPLLLTVLGVYFAACTLFTVATGVVLVRRVPVATTFLAAWMLMAIGAVARFLDAKGVAQNLDSLTLMKLGSLTEATILSLGLAKRVRAIERERGRAQARLWEARHERLAALSRVVAGFAHELGNPLNFVLGGGTEAVARVEAAESLLDSERRRTDGVGKALRAARQALGLVVSGSERMKRILDNLRCYVRDSDVDPVPTDMVACVRSTLVLVAPLLEQTGTHVTLDVAEVPAVEARPGELEQVFMNLVQNACQAMGERGGELTITVSAEEDRVRAEFEDTGPGIPESQREKVFEPFFTTRERHGGTGLGLYVSQDIVARNGGELRIEESATGARFVVSFPRASS